MDVLQEGKCWQVMTIPLKELLAGSKCIHRVVGLYNPFVECWNNEAVDYRLEFSWWYWYQSMQFTDFSCLYPVIAQVWYATITFNHGFSYKRLKFLPLSIVDYTIKIVQNASNPSFLFFGGFLSTQERARAERGARHHLFSLTIMHNNNTCGKS